MDPPTNAPEYSVTELSGAIRRTMEDAFGRVRVRGEIAGYRGPSSSGHVYFALKDANSRIEAVIWKGAFSRLRAVVDEGLEVIATGKITTFAGSSKYQIVIEEIEPAGMGALLMQLEQRRKRLAAEGLFAAERKKPIPFLPEVIGVITSPTGAVIRDILHRLADRFPRHVIIWPVRVQGESSAEEVRRAILGFNDLTHDDVIVRPDLLIVARGGGSLEDLWGFNDEALARVVAESGIPLISAVGHETDTTLIDFVSDLRAPTPTAAAERAVPVRAELMSQSEAFGLRLRDAARRLIERRRVMLSGSARALPQPDGLFAPQRQRLDFAAARLPEKAQSALASRERRLAELRQRLSAQSPAARLARFGERLEGFGQRLKMAVTTRIDKEKRDIARRRERLPDLGARLEMVVRTGLAKRMALVEARFGKLQVLGHHSVLARGYAVVLGEDGRTIRSAAAASEQTHLTLRFADGDAGAIPDQQQRQDRPKPQQSRKPSTGAAGQGNLF
jgi:exodeoxyribonuclease VII large subunit